MTEPAATEMTPEQTAAMMARIRRMMLIAALTTGLGMAAILVVIGYRISRSEGTAAPTDLTEMLPKGARIVSTSVANDRLVVTVEAGGVLEIRTFDARTLKPTGRLKFANQP
ncbi:hypothetical protein X566_04590 [Afipia sp. P52-10]|jgi:hypothetical protein|uniref:DUF6476 family protein n=1 Tax=Afipia sp. P52-10 TaxID=1429916 RepID=UPI0003DF0BCE|nr:DUF6476 family protein [Afipia sp. P52-10]ETR76983.1 hypothetical protein X566_04590 [Afipia sp. P52-10]